MIEQKKQSDSDRPSPGRRYHQSVMRAVAFLIDEGRRGFPEGRHRLKFPVLTPAGVRFETHATDLFQRLIVMDSLLDVQNAGISIDSSLVRNEVAHYIEVKHPDVRGGWSYMPRLPQFPPDADDLAAVLHVAARVKNDALSTICDDALNVVQESAMNEDGSVETWILDRNDASVHGAAIRRYIEVIGGVGVHPEVVANLLSGVIEYAPDRFQNMVEKGAEYLISKQTMEGYWPSKWYWGEAYGTFRALQVLQSIGKARHAVEKALEWAAGAHRQREDGFGVDPLTPLATALILLCLAPELKKPLCRDAFTDGVDHLLSIQHEDGSWDACPFIKMETRNGVLSYGSRTVTTAFCVKALVNSLVTP